MKKIAAIRFYGPTENLDDRGDANAGLKALWMIACRETAWV